jgi:hypothetical protein
VSTMDSGHSGADFGSQDEAAWTDEEKRSICFQTTTISPNSATIAETISRESGQSKTLFVVRAECASENQSESPVPISRNVMTCPV